MPKTKKMTKEDEEKRAALLKAIARDNRIGRIGSIECALWNAAREIAAKGHHAAEDPDVMPFLPMLWDIHAQMTALTEKLNDIRVKIREEGPSAVDLA